MDGFDIYGNATENVNVLANSETLNSLLKSSGYVTASNVGMTTGTRTGLGQAIYFSSGSGLTHDANIKRAFPNKSAVVTGFAVKYSDSDLDRICEFLFDDQFGTVTRQMCLFVNAQAGISLSIAGTSLLAASQPNIIFPHVWHYVEVKYIPRKGNTGVVIVRVDGAVVMTYSGTSCNQDAPDLVNMIRWGNYSDDFSHAVSYSYGIQWLDDVYVCDTLGAEFNDFLGDVVVHTCVPRADAGPNQMSSFGGTVSHYSTVDEIGPDEDVSYLYTNTLGQQEFFEIEAMPSNIIDVLAVSVHARCKKDSPGLGKIKLKARHDTSVVEGGEQALAIQYTTRHLILELAPDGTAWTKAKAEATHIGFEVV